MPTTLLSPISTYPHQTASPLIPPSAATLLTSSLTPLPSIAQLTDRIDTLVEQWLSLESLQTLQQTTFPHPAYPLRPTADLHLQDIATAYGSVCAQLWQNALFPQQADAPPHTPSLDQSNSLLTAQPLHHSIKVLTYLWLVGKANYPQNPFFKNATTLDALRAKWHHPAIQSSLRHTTRRLYQASPYGEWLESHPTCWAYTTGHTMHQLLQWNHRLTSEGLREFLSIDGENTDDIIPT
ncbi:MAG: hypothetical protein AAFO84_17440 [Cyanobacteria bacterium J06598_1]